MFKFVTTLSWSVLLLSGVVAFGQPVPGELSHQGLVSVGGVPFTGTGDFRFAIVDPDTGTNL